MAIPAFETDSTNTSPPISTILPSPVPPTQIHNVHHHILEKLTQDNYILYRFLMIPFLEGQNLFRYVDGTTPRPPQFILNTTLGLLVANPYYQSWYHQDRMIFNAIISTLSVEALPISLDSQLPVKYGSHWKLSSLLNLNPESCN